MTDERSTRAATIALIVMLAGCGGKAGGVIGQPGGPGGPGATGPPWSGYARDAQHSAQSPVASQPLARIHWRTPVDLAPQYVNGDLLAHYGSPVNTPSDTVLVPVKTGPTDGFRVEAHNGTSGSVMWQFASDYRLPPHNWTPSFSPSLTPANRLYFAGRGGKLFYRDHPDSAQGSVHAVVFYGTTLYEAHKAAFDNTVFIDTPITSDSQGDAFFGFTVTGANPAALTSGIARIDASGQGTWIGVVAASGDGSMTQVAMNCAPAVSADLRTIYIAVSDGHSGYLLALDSTTLAPKGKALLADPVSNQPAYVSNDGTASPTVGPDGDVYYGVLESNVPDHNDRGWLLHFDATLGQQKITGSFGWDDTVSIVPSSMVPAYLGTSSYLLMTKYNNYAGLGTGDGQNKIAVLDPNATEPDPVSGNPVMNEVLTILGVTPDPAHPGGVREWCINSAAVDPATKSILANDEDGYLYRWDLTTPTVFAERIALTSGIGEAYTPTSIGPDGQVYAINNAVLFAIGQ